jgi:nicotinamide mononucleotide transporter
MRNRTQLIGYCLGALISAALIMGSVAHLLPLELTEVLGFASGGLCVWLTVEESIWNWPIGIANSSFFLLLFLQSHLFADMALQGVYIVLGLLGWYWWLRGGQDRAPLHVTRTGSGSALVLTALAVTGTWLLTLFLQSIGDSAPFWDALTTALSLVAQYMLTRKYFENWSIWIAADVIYIGLYTCKHLVLTAILYIVFTAMCVAGWIQWRRSLSFTPSLRESSPIEEEAVGA